MLGGRPGEKLGYGQAWYAGGKSGRSAEKTCCVYLECIKNCIHSRFVCRSLSRAPAPWDHTHFVTVICEMTPYCSTHTTTPNTHSDMLRHITRSPRTPQQQPCAFDSDEDDEADDGTCSSYRSRAPVLLCFAIESVEKYQTNKNISPRPFNNNSRGARTKRNITALTFPPFFCPLVAEAGAGLLCSRSNSTVKCGEINFSSNHLLRTRTHTCTRGQSDYVPSGSILFYGDLSVLRLSVSLGFFGAR